MNIPLVIAFVGMVVFLAHLLAEIFSRTKVPDVLSLFLLGFLIGPVFKLVSPEHFGNVGPVFTTITLVIILFEGGMGLHLDELRSTMRPALTLTVAGFFATMLIVGAVTWSFLGPTRAFMLGAIVGGTSSAVVIPLVAQLKMEKGTKAVLIVESAVSDVLCIVFAIAFLEAYRLGEVRVGAMAGHIVASFFIAAIIGVAAAFLWSVLLSRVRTLRNSLFTTPAFVFVIFAVAEMFEFSGAITSLAFGIALGNVEAFKVPRLKQYMPHEPIAPNEIEKAFFSEIVFLLKTFFFIYIGLSIQLKDPLWLTAGLVLTALIFVARVPVVRFSMSKRIPPQDASFMATIVPKGLAAAVLASIPLQQGVEDGELIQNVTYSIILFSIIATSILIFLLEKTSFSKLYERLLKTAKQEGLKPVEIVSEDTSS